MTPETSWHQRLATLESEIREKSRRGERLARNTHAEHDQTLSFGQRVSDRLAEIAGSWTFLISFFVFLTTWVLLNITHLFAPWDAYPFILLNLMLSMLAAVQAPVIMMSQRRSEARDRLRAENDYEVNLKAEIEIQELHRKLDDLRERHIQDFITIQQRQLAMIDTLLQEMRKS